MRYALDSANRWLRNLFQVEIENRSVDLTRIRPLNLINIEDLEEVLPYLKDISLVAILDEYATNQEPLISFKHVFNNLIRSRHYIGGLELRKVLDGTYHSEHGREALKNFSAFVDKIYLPFANENHSGYAHDVYRTDVLKQFFGGKRFDEITMMNVVKYINDRLDSTTVHVEAVVNGTKVYRKRSPTTVNKEVTLLSSIFRMAKREKVAINNPCEDLPRSVRKKIPARYRRNRFLAWEEEKKLFEFGLVGRREHLRPLVHLAIWTGMRRGELLRLKREHVNLGKAPLTFRVRGERIVLEPNWLLMEKTKNGKPRSIPLSRSVRKILATLCSDITADGYVFGNPMTGSHVKDIKHGFRGACDEAGIEDLTFHDLRHTWSTRAAECGVTGTVRRDILGHSSSTMTGDYTHSTPESQMAAMELVASYKSRILDKISTKCGINAVAAAISFT